MFFGRVFHCDSAAMLNALSQQTLARCDRVTLITKYRPFAKINCCCVIFPFDVTFTKRSLTVIVHLSSQNNFDLSVGETTQIVWANRLRSCRRNDFDVGQTTDIPL